MSVTLLCVGGPKHGINYTIPEITSSSVNVLEFVEESPTWWFEGTPAPSARLYSRVTSYWVTLNQLRVDDVTGRLGEFDLYGRQILLHESLYAHDAALVDSMVKDAVYRMWMQDEPYGVRRYDRLGYLRSETLS